jgi:hypothetical protein
MRHCCHLASSSLTNQCPHHPMAHSGECVLRVIIRA